MPQPKIDFRFLFYTSKNIYLKKNAYEVKKFQFRKVRNVKHGQVTYIFDVQLKMFLLTQRHAFFLVRSLCKFALNLKTDPFFYIIFKTSCPLNPPAATE